MIVAEKTHNITILLSTLSIALYKLFFNPPTKPGDDALLLWKLQQNESNIHSTTIASKYARHKLNINQVNITISNKYEQQFKNINNVTTTLIFKAVHRSP